MDNRGTFNRIGMIFLFHYHIYYMNFQNFKSYIVTHKRESHYVALFNFEISILKFSFILQSISQYVTFNFQKYRSTMISLKLQHGYSREISRAFVTIYELPMNLNVQQRATLTQFHSKDQWVFVCLHMSFPIDHHNLCDIIYNYMLHSNTTVMVIFKTHSPLEHLI